MRTTLYLLFLLFSVSSASAQTDTTASAIDNKVEQASEVRKQQNLDAVRSDPTPQRKMQTPETPATASPAQTSTTSTNNGSNKSSGNAQPSTTPDAVNTPSGVGNNTIPANTNPTGKP